MAFLGLARDAIAISRYFRHFFGSFKPFILEHDVIFFYVMAQSTTVVTWRTVLIFKRKGALCLRSVLIKK